MRKNNIFTYDLETTATDKPEIYSWGIMFEDERYVDGISAETFLDEIDKIDEDLVGYARNGSKFDGQFIKDILTRYGYTQKIFDSKILSTIEESEYKEWYLNEKKFEEFNNLTYNELTDKQKRENKLLKPYEYSLMVDGNHKIIEIKIGLPSFKITKGVKKHRVVRLRDSNLLFGGSIKSLGETLNKHYKTDIYSKGEGDSGISYTRTTLYESMEEFDNDGNERQYLKQDCWIDLSYLKLMMEKLPFNEWKLTSASTAYSQWIKILGERIESNLVANGTLERVKPSKSSDTDSFYKLRYKGRDKLHSTTKLRKKFVEGLLPTGWMDLQNENGTFIVDDVYQWFRGGLTHMNPSIVGIVLYGIKVDDIVSSYPDRMNSDLDYPIGVPFIGDGGDDYPLKFYEVELLTNCINEKGLPFIPVLNEKSLSYEYRNKLDKGSTFYMIEEEVKRFKKYYKGKFKKKVKYSFKTVKGTQLFGDYVDKYFQMKSDAKKSGDEGETSIAKLMLNALYGKFGTKSIRTSRIWNDKDMQWEKEQVMIQSKFYLPIAVCITAYARMKLVDAVGEFYEDYIGGDTDSIFYIGDRISSNITYSKKLGDWEREYEDMNGSVIRPKQYYFYKEQDGKKIQKVGLAGINLHRKIDELTLGETTFLDELTIEDMLFGKKVHNQLRPKRYVGYGIRLEEVIKEIKPIWDKPPLYNQWFKNSLEYQENYHKQKERILNIDRNEMKQDTI